MLNVPCLLTFSSCLLLLISHCKTRAKGINYYSIEGDLAQFNITCIEDKCGGYESDSLLVRPCHCGKQCSQLNTCCLNSIYVDFPQPKLKPACVKTDRNDYYFIVNKCPSDSIWADLCNSDKNDDEDNHVQKVVPVTSLFTSITYKNYYCFRCHETTHDFLFWKLWIESDFIHDYKAFFNGSDNSEKHIFLAYNNVSETWMAVYDEKVGYFPVRLSFQIPFKEKQLEIHACVPDVISDCSPYWSDDEVKNKSQSYMALKEVENDLYYMPLKYRNIHCALCNFENLKDVRCRHGIRGGGFGGGRPFPFSYLLDINRSDGEIVEKKQKCPDDHVSDHFAIVCRKLRCALPGFYIKNGKCIKN